MTLICVLERTKLLDGVLYRKTFPVFPIADDGIEVIPSVDMEQLLLHPFYPPSAQPDSETSP
jgi:hypothetical protein